MLDFLTRLEPNFGRIVKISIVNFNGTIMHVSNREDSRPISGIEQSGTTRKRPRTRHSSFMGNSPKGNDENCFSSLKQRKIGRSLSSSAELPAGFSSHLSPPELKGTDQSAPSLFDFRFVSSDQDVLDTLNALTGDDKQHEVTLMANPDGLQRDNLVRRLTITETGRHITQEGRLFLDQVPLTLVLDIRSMNAGELTQFNDLLDPESPCLYDKQTKTKRKLGSHVRVLVLAAHEQLTKAGSADSQAPGADFWRRVNRPGNTWQFTNAVSDSEPMDTTPDHFLPEYPASDGVDSAIMVDLHIYPDWRSQLFGKAGVNDSGRICHIPGVLEKLEPGQKVILKGADWSDLELRHQVNQLQNGKPYYSNGTPHALPGDIDFFQAGVSEEEIDTLCQSSMKLVTSVPDKPVIINQANLDQWLNPININDEGLTTPNTTLLSQLLAGATITITSPLSEPMWFVLLGHLREIEKQTGKRPEVFLAHSKNQPDWIPADSEHSKSGLPANSTTKVIRYNSQAQFSDWRNKQQIAPLVIRINAQTRPGQLFDNLHVLSEQTPRFGRNATQLQQALLSGKPVVFLGLESNPEMQQILESLFCQPASVIINGSLLEFPESDIYFFWQSTDKKSFDIVDTGDSTCRTL